MHYGYLDPRNPLVLTVWIVSDVNLAMKDHTPLHMATKAKFSALCELLIQVESLDLNPVHPRLHTPLWMAFTSHQHDLCVKLIARGSFLRSSLHFWCLLVRELKLLVRLDL